MNVDALKAFVGDARWFGGKGREFEIGQVRRLAGVPGAPDEGPTTYIHLVELRYDDGGVDLYQVPLVFYEDPQARLDHAFVGWWEDPDVGWVHAYDALHDRDAMAGWLHAFESKPEGELRFERIPGHELDLEAHSTLFSGEQSNSSVAFGEDSILKVFRKITPGINPDIAIHEVLTEAGSEHVAKLYGWVEADTDEGRVHLAMIQEFLRTATDGWELALASVRDLFAEGDLHADEVGGDFAGEAARLGAMTGAMHVALADAFGRHPADAKEWAASISAQVDGLEPGDLDIAGAHAIIDDLTALDTGSAGFDGGAGAAIRVHGDYHLGQVLRTDAGWFVLDFEGEPARPLEERRRPSTPLKDVAGMLRSLHYASAVARTERDEYALEDLAAAWEMRNRQAFLRGYMKAAGDGGILPTDQEGVATVLAAFELEKAVYELGYERAYRPDWAHIPLAALRRLTERET